MQTPTISPDENKLQTPVGTSVQTTADQAFEHKDHHSFFAVNIRRPRSLFIATLVVFLLLNHYLSYATPFRFDSFAFPYRGWSWWTINDLRKQTAEHNVALLGSSLMVSAVAGTDANYLNKPLDLANYHKASYLEHLLRTRFGGTFSTANLSAPGQMPSDAYLTLKATVNCANRPDVVVYGIAPRDFIDSTLSTPADTEPFRYLKRLVAIDDIAGKIFESPYAKLDWWLQRTIYLYGEATNFQMATNQGVTKFLATAVPKPYNNPPFTWWDRVRLIPNYLPTEIHPEAVMAGPIDEKTARARYSDNRMEYAARYKHPNVHTYRTQVYFLRQLARYCQKERMELILVNMPITLYNVSMLPPGVYMKYLQDMRAFAANNNVEFYDLSNFQHYSVTDFHDSVHLNAYGGKKFFEELAKTLASNGRSATVLSLAGDTLAKHEALASNERTNNEQKDNAQETPKWNSNKPL